jgi:plastocyanin
MRNVFLLVGVVLALAGCGGNSTTTEAKTEAPPSIGATVTGTIAVTETEYSIAPATINVPKPGLYVFKAVNKGRVTHALEIEGQGRKAESSEIPPGATASVRVSLTKSGSYEVYCPIDGHRGRGMTAKLVVGNVTGAPTVSGTTTAATTTGGGSGY